MTHEVLDKLFLLLTRKTFTLLCKAVKATKDVSNKRDIQSAAVEVLDLTNIAHVRAENKSIADTLENIQPKCAKHS